MSAPMLDPDGPDDPDDSEAASDKTPRRGRPRVTDAFWDNEIEKTLNTRTRRSSLKRFHGQRAYNVLSEGADEGRAFAHIIGDEGKGIIARMGILAALGQLGKPARIRVVAAYICNRKLNGKDAVAHIHMAKKGGAAPGDPDVLAAKITKVIRDYKSHHLSMTDDEIRGALEIARSRLPSGG